MNEWSGVGNYLDFGARGYDSRVARFNSLDPLIMGFPGQSPYIFAGNSPIAYIDDNGELKMKPGDAAKYPNLNAYLKNGIIEMANNLHFVQVYTS